MLEEWKEEVVHPIYGIQTHDQRKYGNSRVFILYTHALVKNSVG